MAHSFDDSNELHLKYSIAEDKLHHYCRMAAGNAEMELLQNETDLTLVGNRPMFSFAEADDEAAELTSLLKDMHKKSTLKPLLQEAKSEWMESGEKQSKAVPKPNKEPKPMKDFEFFLNSPLVHTGKSVPSKLTSRKKIRPKERSQSADGAVKSADKILITISEKRAKSASKSSRGKSTKPKQKQMVCKTLDDWVTRS